LEINDKTNKNRQKGKLIVVYEYFMGKVLVLLIVVAVPKQSKTFS
jgi:hypothetical protein